MEKRRTAPGGRALQGRKAESKPVGPELRPHVADWGEAAGRDTHPGLDRDGKGSTLRRAHTGQEGQFEEEVGTVVSKPVTGSSGCLA